jgi:D-3-phosphoglycerate dehydrogenase
LRKNSDCLEFDVEIRLPRKRLLQTIQNYEILSIKTGTVVDETLLRAGKNLKAIARAGVGLDHIDVRAAEKRGIAIIHTPEASTVAVAELTVCMLIALMRKAKVATLSLFGGQWRDFEARGFEISGKTVGIIGYGRIGSAVADRLRAFGAKILAYDPYQKDQEGKRSLAEAKFVQLEKLLSSSDIVCLHTPLTDETYQLMARKNLKQLKPGTFLINTARGALVSEADILWALEKEILAGYACDVFDREPPSRHHPFLKNPRIISSPHIGAQTYEAQASVQSLLANRIVKFVKTGKIETSPDLKWAMMWNPKTKVKRK